MCVLEGIATAAESVGVQTAVETGLWMGRGPGLLRKAKAPLGSQAGLAGGDLESTHIFGCFLLRRSLIMLLLIVNRCVK